VLRHIRLLVFDLDYVVFDSAALKITALRQSLVCLADAIPHSAKLPDAADAEESFRDYGYRWVEHLDLGLPEPASPLAEAYRIHERRLIEAGAGRIYPALVPLLSDWRTADIELALGADATRDYLLDVSDRHKLDDTFGIALCSEEFGMGSVDEMLEEIMRLAQVNRSETIVLGTRPEYLRAARDLDLVTIACGWGLQNRESVAVADFRALAPAEVQPAILRTDERAMRYH